MSRQLAFTLVHSHARDASRFLEELATTSLSFKTARTITGALSTRKTEPHAKHADLGSVSWLECPNLDQDMGDGQTGSKFTVSCNRTHHLKVAMIRQPLFPIMHGPQKEMTRPVSTEILHLEAVQGHPPHSTHHSRATRNLQYQVP